MNWRVLGRNAARSCRVTGYALHGASVKQLRQLGTRSTVSWHLTAGGHLAQRVKLFRDDRGGSWCHGWPLCTRQREAFSSQVHPASAQSDPRGARASLAGVTFARGARGSRLPPQLELGPMVKAASPSRADPDLSGPTVPILPALLGPCPLHDGRRCPRGSIGTSDVGRSNE